MTNTPQAIRISSMSGVGWDRKPYGLSYPWIKTDAGRSESRRPKQKNDCTVRAVALVRHLSYDDAYDLLAAAGRECRRGFNIVDWLATQPWARKIPFPAVKGKPRMNPATFVKQFPTGTYICRVAKHVFAVRNGVVLDDFENIPNRCIYSAWAIDSDRRP
ncbi:MAG: hypothetical protein OEL20_04905 [Sulfuritalea sp.]|nr:hypothetical protein [Sulfuritalea sp.]